MECEMSKLWSRRTLVYGFTGDTNDPGDAGTPQFVFEELVNVESGEKVYFGKVDFILRISIPGQGIVPHQQQAEFLILEEDGSHPQSPEAAVARFVAARDEAVKSIEAELRAKQEAAEKKIVTPGDMGAGGIIDFNSIRKQ